MLYDLKNEQPSAPRIIQPKPIKTVFFLPILSARRPAGTKLSIEDTVKTITTVPHILELSKTLFAYILPKDSIALKDASTGQVYNVRINNGVLEMVLVDEEVE